MKYQRLSKPRRQAIDGWLPGAGRGMGRNESDNLIERIFFGGSDENLLEPEIGAGFTMQ